MVWREQVYPGDLEVVRDLCTGSGFFNPAEIQVAQELVEERLAKGPACGYNFLFAQEGERVIAYACYGPIPGTAASWDLYWIVVDTSRRSGGVGGRLLRQVEGRVAAAGGRSLYVETSSRPLYLPTRAFYENKDYELAASLPEFYGPQDDKLIYVRRLK